MLHSVFVITSQGEVVIEKHWQSKLPRAAADDFYTEFVVPARHRREVPPVLVSSRYCYVHVLSGDLIFLAVCTKDAPVVLVLEVLHSIVVTLERYFGQLSEDTIRDNFAVTYALLEETIDDGFPMTFEPTLLRDLVPPPSLRGLVQTHLGGTKSGPTLDLSVVPWRKHGIRYSNNEIFFDIVEELHAVLDREGKAVCAEVMGHIECNCRLTGMPDVLVQLRHGDAMDDVAFHPCVRYGRYEQDKSLHFIPPDGQFTLATYRLAPGRNPLPPFYVQPQISFGDGEDGGKATVMVGFRGGGGAGTQAKGGGGMSGGAGDKDDKKEPVQDVRLRIPMPSAVDGCDCTATQGKSWFDYTDREVVWEIGRINKQKQAPNLSIAMHLSAAEERPTALPPVIVDYKMPQSNYSDLKIDSVTLLNEKYRPYKGVRSMSRAGKVIVRA
eukprot:Hpha_TRINITY_DN19141_c0_g1::TRINITY_DN19141_c0_g1_i1::g.94821::m.94821/K12398/AP3M; AP-3 complex subunit mu